MHAAVTLMFIANIETSFWYFVVEFLISFFFVIIGEEKDSFESEQTENYYVGVLIDGYNTKL